MALDTARFLTPIAISALLASCSKPSAKTADVAPLAAPLATDDTESLEILRESAREVLDRNCGECHTSALPTALPRALAVYDLTQLDWSRRMSAAQLRDAEGRLHEPIAPTLGEEEARAVRVSSEEMERFHRYVEMETSRRGAVK
jgi:mono/diheme cytochrome c family protein